MICKWCGAKVREKDRTCPRCGQELPPLSECGGFYDLVPGARQGVTPPPAPPVQPSQPVQPMPPTDGPTAYYSPRKKKQDNSIVWLCVWIILMAVVIALLIQSCTLSNRLDDIDERLSKLSNSTEGTSTDIPGDSSEDLIGNFSDDPSGDSSEDPFGDFSEDPSGDPSGNPEAVKNTTDEPTEETTEVPTEDSTKNEIELTLDVDSEERINLAPQSNTGWMVHDRDNEFYRFKYTESDPVIIFSISCSEEDDCWTLECKQIPSVTCTWQWQTMGTSVVGAVAGWKELGTSEGYMSVCPNEYNSDDSLRCILTWELEKSIVTVTINFEND